MMRASQGNRFLNQEKHMFLATDAQMNTDFSQMDIIHPRNQRKSVNLWLIHVHS